VVGQLQSTTRIPDPEIALNAFSDIADIIPKSRVSRRRLLIGSRGIIEAAAGFPMTVSIFSRTNDIPGVAAARRMPDPRRVRGMRARFVLPNVAA
jgi:hypothetical protein